MIDIKELLNFIFKLKSSVKPISIDPLNKNLSKKEIEYFVTHLYKIHGVIITSVDKGHVNYCVMTHVPLLERHVDNELKFLILNKEKYLIFYRTPLIEFKDLLANDNFISNSTFDQKQLFIDELFKLDDSNKKLFYLSSEFFLENPNFQELDVVDQKFLVEQFAKSKGLNNYEIKYLTKSEQFAIYLNMDLNNFINEKIVNLMLDCTCDEIDVTTRLGEFADSLTRDILTDIIQVQMLILKDDLDHPHFCLDSVQYGIDCRSLDTKVSILKPPQEFVDYISGLEDINISSLLEENKLELE